MHRNVAGWTDGTMVSLTRTEVGEYMCCQRVHMRDWEFSDPGKVSLRVGRKVWGDSFLRQVACRDRVLLRGHGGVVCREVRWVVGLYRLCSRHYVADPVYGLVGVLSRPLRF